MAAFSVNDFTTASVDTVSTGYLSTPNDYFNVASIPYVAAYYRGAGIYLLVQFDRNLATLSATTLISNYTIAGAGSPPTVTNVNFTPGNSYLILTLSGLMPSGSHTLSLAERTVFDGTSSYNSFPLAAPILDASQTLQGNGFNWGVN